ncbi:DEAD/DEAH box helicase [Zooshikella sp. RANM57]|uniref:DEAD/DEAH box helicase n=1 Tax=Zooshikella sp. RANM57 TaxID=3425863 RepID=UPI003D6DEBC9
MQLRWYQREALDATNKYLAEEQGNPLVCVSTGGGKSVIIAKFIEEYLSKKPNARFIVLSHVKEILEQNYSKLALINPLVDVGIYSASLKRKDTESTVLFAGIQSVHKKAFDLPPYDFILVDECHLINADADSSMYIKFLNHAKLMNPNVRMIGFSATPYRTKTGLLTEGKNALFHKIVYETDIQQLIDEGFLSPLITKGGQEKIDLTGVRTRQGEFATQDMEKAVHKNSLTDKALDEICELGADRQSWLIFGVSVAHCLEIEEKLKKKGVSALTVHGKTPENARNEAISVFKQGRLRCLISQGVLTTGFDAPRTDLIALLRSTKSPGLYMQIMGRGLRISPETNKTNCLVLDYGSNVERHGPIDQVHVTSPEKKKKGAAPVRQCPECNLLQLAARRTCENCGLIFEIEEKPIHDHSASKDAVLSSQIQAEWVPVSDVNYFIHTKKGSPNSIRVAYRTGFEFINEWVCPEHEGYAKTKALTWWAQRVGYDKPMPESTNEAVRMLKTIQVKTPRAIQVKPDGKFKKIMSYEFN